MPGKLTRTGIKGRTHADVVAQLWLDVLHYQAAIIIEEHDPSADVGLDLARAARPLSKRGLDEVVRRVYDASKKMKQDRGGSLHMWFMYFKKAGEDEDALRALQAELGRNGGTGRMPYKRRDPCGDRDAAGPSKKARRVTGEAHAELCRLWPPLLTLTQSVSGARLPPPPPGPMQARGTTMPLRQSRRRRPAAWRRRGMVSTQRAGHGHLMCMCACACMH